MRDGAAIGQDLITRCLLDVVECTDRVSKALVAEAKVEVQACTSVVRLRHAAAHLEEVNEGK